MHWYMINLPEVTIQSKQNTTMLISNGTRQTTKPASSSLKINTLKGVIKGEWERKITVPLVVKFDNAFYNFSY